MILKKYSQKQENLEAQYKEYLKSCASLVNTTKPIKFEFKNSNVYVELRRPDEYTSQEKLNELERNLSSIYEKETLIWIPEEHLCTKLIQQEFRDFITSFGNPELKFNDTLSIKPSILSSPRYIIDATEHMLGSFEIIPQRNLIELKLLVLHREVTDTSLKMSFVYGWQYTHRNLWQYLIRTIKKVLVVKDWKFV